MVYGVPSLQVEEPTTLSGTTPVEPGPVSEQNKNEESSPFPPQPKLSDYYVSYCIPRLDILVVFRDNQKDKLLTYNTLNRTKQT